MKRERPREPATILPLLDAAIRRIHSFGPWMDTTEYFEQALALLAELRAAIRPKRRAFLKPKAP